MSLNENILRGQIMSLIKSANGTTLTKQNIKRFCSTVCLQDAAHCDSTLPMASLNLEISKWKKMCVRVCHVAFDKALFAMAD